MTTPSRIILALLWVLACGETRAQMRFSGQGSVGLVKANDGYSQYSYNGGRATFNWRADFFADAVIAEDVTFLSNARIQQDEQLHIDLFAIRLSNIASTPLNAELGEVEMPFLSLGERRFPKNNPFIDLPLIREHRTTLRSSDYELWPWNTYYTTGGNGVRILDGGLYDLGVKLYGSVGVFDIAVAVTNGMVSATSSYSPGGLNTHRGFGKLVRVAATPTTGLTIGASYANGPFLGDAGGYSYAPYGSVYDPMVLRQEAIGGDIDFSYGHFALYGEAVYNVWRFASVYGSDLRAAGYSLEGRYALTPRLSVAARAGGMAFNTIDAVVTNSIYGFTYYDGRWDHDRWRLEGAIGYRLSRESLIKFVYQWNRTLGVSYDPADDVAALQAVVSIP